MTPDDDLASARVSDNLRRLTEQATSHAQNQQATHPILHHDIFRLMTPYSSLPTQAILLQASRLTFDLVAPTLYRHFTVSRSTISRMFSGPTPNILASDYSKDHLLSITRHLALPLHSTQDCVDVIPPHLPNLHTLELILSPDAPLG